MSVKGCLFFLALCLVTASRRDVVPASYIIEVYKEEDIERIAEALSGQAVLRREFRHEVFTGLSVDFDDATTDDHGETLLSLDAKNFWPMAVFHLPSRPVEVIPQVNTSQHNDKRSWSWLSWMGMEMGRSKDDYEPHVMTQIDQMHKKGILGNGIKIAVIDTGIDYKHPALGLRPGCDSSRAGCGNCFGKNCLTTYGADFVGDEYDGTNRPVADDDPMDCNGHGTHLAGIISARNNRHGFLGAAPGARLGAYKVTGCKGGAGEDVLMAASLQAYEDGSDIILATIGEPSGWEQSPWSLTLSRISALGVPCITSAGDSGSSGVFNVNSGASGNMVSAVGSVDSLSVSTMHIASEWTAQKGETKTATKFDLAIGEPGQWNSGTKALYALSLDDNDGKDACEQLPKDIPDLSQHIVLVRRSRRCSLDVQATNIGAKGARYMIVHNMMDDTFGPTVQPVPDRLLGVAMVSYTLGAQWTQSVKRREQVQITVPQPSEWLEGSTAKVLKVPNSRSGGLVSDMSSWGPTWGLSMKPQFTAPGGKIVSTWSMAGGGYAVMSGTSAAAPLVAAAVALIFEARGRLGPSDLTRLLSATAVQHMYWDNSKRHEAPAPPSQQGAGMIQVYSAAYSTTQLHPSHLAFNDTDNFQPLLEFAIENQGSSRQEYTINNVPAVTVYTFGGGDPPIPILTAPAGHAATLNFTHEKVPVKSIEIDAGKRAIIWVHADTSKVKRPKLLPVWGGYITVNGTDGSNLVLPYQGLVGSLREEDLLTPASFLRPTGPGSLAVVEPGVSVTMPAPSKLHKREDGGRLPGLYVSLALHLGTAHLSISVGPPEDETADDESSDNGSSDSDISDGPKILGHIHGFPKRFQSRGRKLFPWDGRLANGSFVPAGRYVVHVRALKLHGDVSNEDSWESVQSYSIYIGWEGQGPRPLPKFVYRGANWSPDKVREKGGFPPNTKGQALDDWSYSLESHAVGSAATVYVSTTTSFVVAYGFAAFLTAGPDKYIYYIKSTPNMIDLTASGYGEEEFSALGGIFFDQIVKWFALPPRPKKVFKGFKKLKAEFPDTAWTPNPDYNDKYNDMMPVGPQPQLLRPGGIDGKYAEKTCKEYAIEFMNEHARDLGWEGDFPLPPFKGDKPNP